MFIESHTTNRYAIIHTDDYTKFFALLNTVIENVNYSIVVKTLESLTPGLISFPDVLQAKKTIKTSTNSAMSSSENGVGCVSEVTLAISKERNSQPDVMRTMDSPDSDGSGHSNSFTVQRFTYQNQTSQNANSESRFTPQSNNELRIPIVGYEVMEERARFTVR